MVLNYLDKKRTYSVNYFQGILLLLLISISSCTLEKSIEDIIVKTDEVSLITETTAFCGGSIISNGDADVTSRGVCWSLEPSPTISLTTKKSVSGGTGAFTINIEGLKSGTLYYARAYATTRIDTFYGGQVSFTTTLKELKTITDIDGNIYHIITLGTQEWLVENLKTTRYQNGDTIGTTMPVTKNIEDESTPKYQWAYNGDVNNVSKYGRLYTWYAVNDIRKISPTGWHVPSDAEWTILENYLIANGYNYDGTTTGNKIARSMASTTDWAQDTETGYLNGTCSIGTDLKKNNASGFSALPGGCREVDGHFWGVTTWEAWWTSTEGIPGYTESFPGNAWYRYLSYTWNNLNRYISDKKCGNSIRCIKD